jgi:hypothetical protein
MPIKDTLKIIFINFIIPILLFVKYGLDDRAIQARSPAEAKDFSL